ncbi:MAG: helix-turn-helix domain-containing protein [Nocardioides sp.]|nr:helix-turn-helix domain-containing protein [Nocardioides sp.]
MDVTSITPSPQALKALTHPVRLRMLGLLRTEGPATATRLATRLGLNSGATSYHLRQLARHGFVVDDEERGNARERWWRAARSTATDNTAADPDASTFSDWVIRLSPQRAQALVEALAEELGRAEGDADESGEQVVVQLTTFPLPGHVTSRQSGATS